MHRQQASAAVQASQLSSQLGKPVRAAELLTNGETVAAVDVRHSDGCPHNACKKQGEGPSVRGCLSIFLWRFVALNDLQSSSV